MKRNPTISVIIGALLIILVGWYIISLKNTGPKIENKTIKPDKNLILIGWNGVSRYQIDALLEKGEMPHLQSIIEEGGIADTFIKSGSNQATPGWAQILTGYGAKRTSIKARGKHIPLNTGVTFLERVEAYFGKETVYSILIGGGTDAVGARRRHTYCKNCPSHYAEVAPAETDSAVLEEIVLPQDYHPEGPTKDGQPPRWVHSRGDPYYYTAQNIDYFLTNVGPADEVGKEAVKMLDIFSTEQMIAFIQFQDAAQAIHNHGVDSSNFNDALHKLDEWLGTIISLLKEKKIYEKTVIFVTSSHSEVSEPKANNIPHMFVASNSKRKLYPGDRRRVAATILDEFGIDPAAVSPPIKESKPSLYTEEHHEK